jgi:mono/diheme cytochrome c family protein
VTWRTRAGAALVVAAVIGTGALWRDRTTEVDRPVPAGLSQFDGEALFRTRGCAGCHESGGPGGSAPGLTAVGDWGGERRPGMSAEQYVAESIRDPQAFISPQFRPVPGQPLQAMPDLELTEEETDAVVAYLLED